jgi:hypothetical protein
VNAPDHRKDLIRGYKRELSKLGLLNARTEADVRNRLMDREGPVVADDRARDCRKDRRSAAWRSASFRVLAGTPHDLSQVAITDQPDNSGYGRRGSCSRRNARALPA